jgi:hydroxymethylbilane synthase
MGGCSTPISGLAEIKDDTIYFTGNILSPDGKIKVEVEKVVSPDDADQIGVIAARELLINGGKQIADTIQYA